MVIGSAFAPLHSGKRSSIPAWVGARLCCAAALSIAGPTFALADESTDTSAWRWDAVYKIDALRADRPVVGTATGLFDLRLTFDAERLFGWSGTTLRVEVLGDHFGQPNRHVGSVQGISNLEVTRTSLRLYASSIEHRFEHGTSVLFGLYDLNSDFYATEASGLLIHPAFGIGSEFAQSGRNGPSIFPNLSLGVRVKVERDHGWYAQAAVLDAVPGDPSHPGQTRVELRAREGALLVGELGRRTGSADSRAPDRWGIGVWNYTRSAPRLDATGTGRDTGVYAIGQAALLERPEGRMVGFLRAGLANARLNPIDAAFDAGVLIDRPWGTSGPAALTAGIAFARIGSTRRRLQAAAGEQPGSHEATLELGARWMPSPSVVLQPLVQHIARVGGKAGTTATLVGVRIEWALSGGGKR